jgi:hypothetical protein
MGYFSERASLQGRSDEVKKREQVNIIIACSL